MQEDEHFLDKAGSGEFCLVKGDDIRSFRFFINEAAQKVVDSIEETLTYCDFTSEHWTRIRTNNVIEGLTREIRRRNRVAETFPNVNSALMLGRVHISCVCGFLSQFLADARPKFADVLTHFKNF